MYLGANKYPEFKGRDKKFVRECIAYAWRKEKIGRRFWSVLGVLVLAAAVWGWWVDAAIPAAWKNLVDIVFPLSCGFIFLVYLLYETNTRMHKAVKKYIGEFENSRGKS